MSNVNESEEASRNDGEEGPRKKIDDPKKGIERTKELLRRILNLQRT